MAKSNNISYKNASGKVGELVVAQVEGQAILRARAFHNESRTEAQAAHRSVYNTIGTNWGLQDRLSRSQWTALGKQMTDRESGRTASKLNGYQAYASVAATLLTSGGSLPDAAMAAPDYPQNLGPVSLTAVLSSRTPSVLTLNIASAGTDETVQLYGLKPLYASQDVPQKASYKLLATLPGLSSPNVDVAAQFQAQFGKVVVGDKIALKLVTISSTGFRGFPAYISAEVQVGSGVE